MEHYEGGWQEIFPNGGDTCIYKGCHLNFHGEASILPWDYTLEQGLGWVSAEFAVSTYRSPFLLRRKLQQPIEQVSQLLKLVVQLKHFQAVKRNSKVPRAVDKR